MYTLVFPKLLENKIEVDCLKGYKLMTAVWMYIDLIPNFINLSSNNDMGARHENFALIETGDKNEIDLSCYTWPRTRYGILVSALYN